MKKYISIDFDKCRPELCFRETGSCPAAETCPRKLLEQEDLDDSPMLISTSLCVGCGDCAKDCPCGALSVVRG